MNNMRLPKLSYHEPKTIDELMDIKKEFGEGCAVLAGGTDIIPMLKRRNSTVSHLANIKRIPEFSGISYDKDKGLEIAPAVTLRDIIDHPSVSKSYPLLAKAAEGVGFNQLRNMATLVGNICLDNKCNYFNQSAFWWKSRPDCFKRGGDQCYVMKGAKSCFALSAADTLSALVTLEAELLIQGPEKERITPVEAFYTGDGRVPHRLDEDEMVTKVEIPAPLEGWREGFMKKSLRGSVDFAIATLSVRLKMENHAVADVRIALNGVSTKPIRARKAEGYMIGKEVNDETVSHATVLILKEAAPLSPIGSSVFYRRNMIQVMFNDLIETITRGERTSTD
jgi:4-hydroxybenzoyl-CoA reductase subunit beta